MELRNILTRIRRFKSRITFESRTFKEIKSRNPNKEVRLLKKGDFKFKYPFLGYSIVNPARSECEYAIALIDDMWVYGLCLERFVIPEYKKRGYEEICRECKTKIPYKPRELYGKPVLINLEEIKPGDLELAKIVGDPKRIIGEFKCDLSKVETHVQDLNKKAMSIEERVQKTIEQVEYTVKDNVRAEKGY